MVAVPTAILPTAVWRIVRGLRYFIVENAKTARAELKRIGIERPIQEIDIRELPRDPKKADLEVLPAPVVAGVSAGLLSEAGAPAVAAPGALLVRAAHVRKVRVARWWVHQVLMASGLNGQRFAFQGYLPVREPERSKSIAEMEQESRWTGCTQVFIETPYRNTSLFAALLESCRPDTLPCVASELTTGRESITTMRIEDWCPPNELRKD